MHHIICLDVSVIVWQLHILIFPPKEGLLFFTIFSLHPTSLLTDHVTKTNMVVTADADCCSVPDFPFIYCLPQATCNNFFHFSHLVESVGSPKIIYCGVYFPYNAVVGRRGSGVGKYRACVRCKPTAPDAKQAWLMPFMSQYMIKGWCCRPIC